MASAARILSAAVVVFLFCDPVSGRAETVGDLGWLVRAIAALSGGTVEEIASLVTVGRRSEQAERSVVRWDQAEVTLGVTASARVPAVLLRDVVGAIEETFRSVNKGLVTCLRSWPGGPEIADADQPIHGCSAPTEIDLVIDIQDFALLKEMDALPTDPSHTYLIEAWSRVKQDLSAEPAWAFCNFGLATDVMATKLVGAAGIIRAPIDEQAAAAHAIKCSTQLGYFLLGSLPIPDKSDGEGGTLNADLLALLYHEELPSGASRSEVLEILRAASGY